MRAFDDHVASGVDVDEGRVARVGLHEPDDDRDVVGHALEHHRNCPFGLEEVDHATIVVSIRRCLWLKARVGVRERKEVLTDQPLDVL